MSDMSIDLPSLAQVSSIIIACCSVTGLIMGIHLCHLNKNIKQMNLCGRCFTVTQFSREQSTDEESLPVHAGMHVAPTVVSRFSVHN